MNICCHGKNIYKTYVDMSIVFVGHILTCEGCL